jgi:hypothetical protein
MANAWYDYLASYNDLIDAFGSDAGRASAHYQQFGENEGRALDNFDEASYLAANPDVAKDPYYSQNAAQHYVEHGRGEGRSLTPQPPSQPQPTTQSQPQPPVQAPAAASTTQSQPSTQAAAATKPAATAAAAPTTSGSNYSADLDKIRNELRNEYESNFKTAKDGYDSALKAIGDTYNTQISSFKGDLKTYQDLANKYQGEASNLGVAKKAAEDRATSLQSEFDAYKKKSETDAADSQLSALRGGYQAASGAAVGGGASLTSGVQVANRGVSDRPGSVVAKLRIDPTDSVLDKGDVVQSLSAGNRPSSGGQTGGARRSANMLRQEAARYYSGRFGG